MQIQSVFQEGSPFENFSDLTQEVQFAFDIANKELIYLNNAFEKIWQLSREDIGASPSHLLNSVHEDDKEHVLESFKALLKDKNSRTVEFRIVSPNTENFKWIKLCAYLTTKDDREFILGNATDISIEKEYNFTLHKFADKKNSALQILSHDLLGPLGNIEITANMLSESESLSTDQSLAKLINLIKRNSQRGMLIIRDLVNEEFLQSSEVRLRRQRADIIAKIQLVIDQYRQSPNLAVPQRFNLISSSDRLFVAIDESKFMQVVNNLLSNALKFTPDTGNIEVTVEDLGKIVRITVKDNGIGIPTDLQPFLFEKFTRAGRQGIRGEPSMGLGMSIIKQIIEWHQGTIWFESVVDQGSSFYIEIPKEVQ